jgi:hypothetical protein
LQSNFFPAKFFFGILEKGILAGKNLLFERVKLLGKEGFSFNNNGFFKFLIQVLNLNINSLIHRLMQNGILVQNFS